MKNIIYLFTLGLLTQTNLTAQSLSPFVISPSGGFYSNANVQLSFTAGEITLVETFAAGNSILTQGFQQPSDFGVFIIEHQSEDFAFDVFPNPNIGTFSIFIKTVFPDSYRLTIYDAVGKIITQTDLEIISGAQSFPMDLSDAREGIYFLELISNQNKIINKIQIIK